MSSQSEPPCAQVGIRRGSPGGRLGLVILGLVKEDPAELWQVIWTEEKQRRRKTKRYR